MEKREKVSRGSSIYEWVDAQFLIGTSLSRGGNMQSVSESQTMREIALIAGLESGRNSKYYAWTREGESVRPDLPEKITRFMKLPALVQQLSGFQPF